MHEGPLGIERHLSGPLLIFDVGAEGLIRLHRHGRGKVGVALDLGKGVLTAEARVAVATQQPSQDFVLGARRISRGVDKGLPVRPR